MDQIRKQALYSDGSRLCRAAVRRKCGDSTLTGMFNEMRGSEYIGRTDR